MAGLSITVVVTGDEALAKRLTPRAVAQPKHRFLVRSGNTLLDRAKANASANVDTGALLASLRSDVHGDSVEVGTDLDYAVYVHEGTRPHWPPIAAVAPWAARHGIAPFLVAKGISEHGTKANPFLADAVDQSTGDVQGYLSDMAREIERNLGG